MKLLLFFQILITYTIITIATYTYSNLFYGAISKYLFATAIFFIFEFIAYVIFSFLNARFFGGDGKPSQSGEKAINHFSKERLHDELVSFSTDNIKGTLERIMLFIGLIMNFPHIIAFLGTIKIGTRLQEAKDCKVTSDYFIIGNAISMVLILIAFKIVGKI